LRRFKKRFWQSMDVDAYGDGELETLKIYISRDDGTPIDSLNQPRHAEFAYTFTVRGWIFPMVNDEVATFVRFVQSFGVQSLTATFQEGGETQFEFDKDYS